MYESCTGFLCIRAKDIEVQLIAWDLWNGICPYIGKSQIVTHRVRKQNTGEFSGVELSRCFRTLEAELKGFLKGSPLQGLGHLEPGGQGDRPLEACPLGNKVVLQLELGPPLSPHPASEGLRVATFLLLALPYLMGSLRGCSLTSSHGGSGTAHSPTWLLPEVPGFSSCPLLRC